MTVLNEASLKDLIDEALGGVTPAGRPSEREWDSLDQLEILTHLNDALGDRVNSIDELNTFTDFGGLSKVLTDEGFLA